MSIDSLKLAVVGINHNNSTIAERETYQINLSGMKGALSRFKSMDGVEGVVIVSTCNRVEFYFALKHGADPFSIVNEYYLKKEIIVQPINPEKFYLYENLEAAEHLFKVASGIDSLLLGEYQILGQMKDSYSIACSEKSADKTLHKLFHAAFRAGKAVRSKTNIGSGNQSLSGVAFNIIKAKLKKKDPVTIVGVNQNTRIIADELFKAGFSHLLFVNRTLYKAEELAYKYNGLSFDLDHIEEPLISSKCVFSCTGAPGYIISADLINKIFSRRGLPVLLIDMAVPRDIETKGLADGIEAIDMEVLKEYLKGQKKAAVLDLPAAENIIADEVALFQVWNESSEDEGISRFEEKIEQIRLQLLHEAEVSSTEDRVKLLDKFSRSLIHKIKPVINQQIRMSSVLVKDQ